MNGKECRFCKYANLNDINDECECWCKKLNTYVFIEEWCDNFDIEKIKKGVIKRRKEIEDMEKYKGYKIRPCGEFYEILNKDGKYIKNELTVLDAKEYIDMLDRVRY